MSTAQIEPRLTWHAMRNVPLLYELGHHGSPTLTFSYFPAVRTIFVCETQKSSNNQGHS